MLKNLIVIENGKSYQFETEQELVKKLICENYYELTEDKKIEAIKIKSIANSLNLKENISENINTEKDFILFLLIDNNNLILLEKKDSNIFTGKLDKNKFSKNYILVNNFAKQLLYK